MKPEAQLEWEGRFGPFAALAAAALPVLTLGGGIYVSAAVTARPDNARELMAALDAEASAFTTSAIIQSVGLISGAFALLYLYRVVKHRHPDFPSFVAVFALMGPIVLALAGVLTQLDRLDGASEFLASGEQTNERAEDLLNETSSVTLGLGLGGALAFGLGLVLLNVNAMRTGIESRFMGIIGVIVGVIPVLGALVPIGGPGFVQVFWFGALAFLFLGKWPRGRGPAWDTGEPIPWPSSLERRQEAGSATQAGAIPADDPTIEPAPGPDDPVGDASDPRGEASPASKKRKRKRKR